MKAGRTLEERMLDSTRKGMQRQRRKYAKGEKKSRMGQSNIKGEEACM